MRITKIAVLKLFGNEDLNHDITLNLESRITIIHGPNGVGKTVILRLLHGLFNYEYELFRAISFEEFRVEFEGGDSITIRELKDSGEISMQFDDGTGELFTRFTPDQIVENAKLLEIVESSEPAFVQILLDKDYYWRQDTSALYSRDDFLKTYPEVITEAYGEVPDWFERIQQETDTEFIRTQRLEADLAYMAGAIAEQSITQSSTPDSIMMQAPTSPLRKIADRLTSYRVQTSDESASSGFRDRFLHSLARVLLTNPGPAHFLLSERIVQILTSEIEKSLRKRKVKRQLTERVRPAAERATDDEMQEAQIMLKEIVNERLAYKDLDFDSNEGLVVLTLNGSTVPLEGLSSGEQHLILLYSRLLLEAKSDDLILIDEPEISLHVSWQRRFLEDIQRIAELRRFDVLIATHSPQIVSDKWDWMVALGNSESDEDDETE